MKPRRSRTRRTSPLPKRKPTVERRRTPSGAPYLFDAATGGVFGLNPAAEVLMDALEVGSSRDDLVAALLASFDVDELEARQDVDGFLLSLAEHGLVVS
jgi:PqqD family protein of HPr-rel-A system